MGWLGANRDPRLVAQRLPIPRPWLNEFPSEQGHQDLAEDRIVIDRQDEAEVAAGAQRVEGRAKATL